MKDGRGSIRDRSLSAAREVEVTALGGRGDAIARLDDGEVIMIRGGVPGDRLAVTVLGRRQGVRRARLEAVLRPSPHRVEPFCSVFGRCGGCTWQAASLCAQRREKRALAARALSSDASLLVEVGRVQGRGWRRRARVHLRSDDAGRLACGLMAPRGDALVQTERCPAMVPALQPLLPGCRDWLQGRAERAEVHAVAGVEGVVCAVDARPAPGGAPPRLDSATLSSVGVVGMRLSWGRHRQSLGAVEVTLPESLGGPPIRVDAAGFCQASEAANVAIRQAVVQAVQACGPISGVQEFFAGSGNLGAALAGHVPEVRCVESNRRAVQRARASLSGDACRGTRYEVIAGDAARLARPARPGELWLLDPGRPGAASLCAAVARHRPLHVLYVSCAPDTLFRDLMTLRSEGYVVRAAVWIDAFPHTPHLEMIVRLQDTSPERRA